MSFIDPLNAIHVRTNNAGSSSKKLKQNVILNIASYCTFPSLACFRQLDRRLRSFLTDYQINSQPVFLKHHVEVLQRRHLVDTEPDPHKFSIQLPNTKLAGFNFEHFSKTVSIGCLPCQREVYLWKLSQPKPTQSKAALPPPTIQMETFPDATWILTTKKIVFFWENKNQWLRSIKKQSGCLFAPLKIAFSKDRKLTKEDATNLHEVRENFGSSFVYFQKPFFFVVTRKGSVHKIELCDTYLCLLDTLRLKLSRIQSCEGEVSQKGDFSLLINDSCIVTCGEKISQVQADLKSAQEGGKVAPENAIFKIHFTVIPLLIAYSIGDKGLNKYWSKELSSLPTQEASLSFECALKVDQQFVVFASFYGERGCGFTPHIDVFSKKTGHHLLSNFDDNLLSINSIWIDCGLLSVGTDDSELFCWDLRNGQEAIPLGKLEQRIPFGVRHKVIQVNLVSEREIQVLALRKKDDTYFTHLVSYFAPGQLPEPIHRPTKRRRGGRLQPAHTP